MCLIAFAHNASPDLPLVLAANRDEDHERPTRAAHFWDDAPQVLGGRDVRAGGGWLAMTTTGRWAAVTNLRGFAPPANARSRGALVGGFVTSSIAPRAYVDSIEVEQYAGFHLFAGEVGGALAYLSRDATSLGDGIHGISNAPHGEIWPKVTAAMTRVERALQLGPSEAIIDDLLAFLATRGDTIETSPFIAGDRYGTRASTVIVATRDQLVFVEQGWGRGGVQLGERITHAFPSPGRGWPKAG